MKIATLGPEGTFSHEAVLYYNSKAHIYFERTIADVFAAVSGNKAMYGIVPIENSTSGTVGLTFDALQRNALFIVDEIILKIKHHLCCIKGAKKIDTIITHPVTYEQCEQFLTKKFNKASIMFSSSNGMSSELLVKNNEKDAAVVTNDLSRKIYKLRIIKKNIQDNKHNFTRFIVISKKMNPKNGKKTSVLIIPSEDMPGLLYGLLGFFANEHINLTKIESRPLKGRLGKYIFFIDFLGHIKDKKVINICHSIQKESQLKILGCYPKRE